MDFVVKEFEREYADGHKLHHIRRFVNQYVIQGGKHARTLKQDHARIDQKLQQIERYFDTHNVHGSMDIQTTN